MRILEGNRKKLLNIIKNECCYYCEEVCQIMGRCIEELNVETVLCKHANQYILPEHPELQGYLYQGKSTGFNKVCKQCNKKFESKSKNKLLCNRCTTLNRRKQVKKQVQKHRNKANVKQGIM